MRRQVPYWLLSLDRSATHFFLLSIVAVSAALTAGCGGSSPPPIPFFISPFSPQAIDQGQSVILTANDPLGKGVNWSLNGSGSLTSTAGPSITYISSLNAITTTQQVTVTATSAADPTKSAALQITVNPFPQIQFQSLPNGAVGAPYSAPIMFTGGTAPIQWSIFNGPIPTGFRVGGAVPDGLRLNPNTGNISGTPTAAGTWYFQAELTDAAGVTFDQGFLSIEIAPTSPPSSPIPFLNQSLVPTSVAPGSAGFTLNLSGAGFSSNSIVNFNRTALATTFVDSRHLTAAVAASNVANPGTAAITVVTPVAGGESNVVYFPVGASRSDVTFASAPNSPLKIFSPGVALGDFNEDGKPDLIVSTSTSFFTFLGNGDGTFTQTPSSPTFIPSPPYDDAGTPHIGPITVGDFNKSGHLGLAITEYQNEAAVIMFGKGDGTFGPSSASFAETFGFPGVIAQPADFNGDGGLDLALVNQLSGRSVVSLGFGTGAFNTAGDLNVGGSATGVAIGDFNADGKLDIVATDSAALNVSISGLSISLGDGDGTFTTPNSSPVNLGQSLSAVVTADFNGDGKLDLAAIDSVGNAALILLGNGNATFGPPLTIPVGKNPQFILSGDFNNDGNLDLAIANFADNTVTLLLGNGNGTFTPSASSPYTVGTGPFQISAADFNADGKLDLAVANITAGTVSILLQQ